MCLRNCFSAGTVKQFLWLISSSRKSPSNRAQKRPQVATLREIHMCPHSSSDHTRISRRRKQHANSFTSTANHKVCEVESWPCQMEHSPVSLQPSSRILGKGSAVARRRLWRFGNEHSVLLTNWWANAPDPCGPEVRQRLQGLSSLSACKVSLSKSPGPVGPVTNEGMDLIN